MMKRKHLCIKDFRLKGYMGEMYQGNIYTSAILEIVLFVPVKYISHFIVRRYQLGEVNNMDYADSVIIKRDKFLCNTYNRTVYLSTNDLGYGKSINPVTYYVQIVPVLKCGYNYPMYSDKSEILCVKIPQGKHVV